MTPKKTQPQLQPSPNPQKLQQVAARARSASIDLNDLAKELEGIATTLPTTHDQALFKATTISKPQRYVPSQSKPLPQLTKKEKVDERARLMELLLTKGYQQLVVNTQEGKVVHFENTRKLKLK